MNRARAFAAMLLISLAGGSARAELCPAPPDAPAVGPLDAQARLDYLAHTFDREVRDTDIWSWSWGSVYTAGAAAQGVGVALSHDHGTRIDLTVGWISTGVGALTLLGLPLQLTLPLRAARGHWSDPDRCATLLHAEQVLAKVESDQALATGIFAHIGNVAVNVGIALILGLGYGRWPSAAISGGVGIAIGELNTFTQPHHLREALERYRAGQLEAPAPALAWTVVPLVAPKTGGAALALAW